MAKIDMQTIGSDGSTAARASVPGEPGQPNAGKQSAARTDAARPSAARPDAARPFGLWSRALVGPALLDSLRKLSPAAQVKNPVMFVV
ncbi:MAG: hypothetical protein ACTHLV_09030, partial [Achromobacter mucicolens]